MHDLNLYDAINKLQFTKETLFLSLQSEIKVLFHDVTQQKKINLLHSIQGRAKLYFNDNHTIVRYLLELPNPYDHYFLKSQIFPLATKIPFITKTPLIPPIRKKKISIVRDLDGLVYFSFLKRKIGFILANAPVSNDKRINPETIYNSAFRFQKIFSNHFKLVE